MPFAFLTADTKLLFEQSMCCNSSANLSKPVLDVEGKSILDDLGKEVFLPDRGNKTEVALLKFIKAAGVDYEAYRETYLSDDFVRFPFSSSRKRMSTVIKGEDGKKATRILLKGASEYVLESCSHIHYWKVGIISIS